MDRPSRLLLVSLVVLLVACPDKKLLEPVPAVASVAGTYYASSITRTDANGTTDYVTAGSHITLVLSVDGTVTGDLLIKGGAVGGGDLVADMSGTWLLHERDVWLYQDADTFMRDIPFLFMQKRLSGLFNDHGAMVWVYLDRK